MSDTRVRVCSAEDIDEDTGRAFDIAGKRIAIFRTGACVFAIGDECPHGNASLADGYVENGTVECPFHSGRFDLATGEPLSPPVTEPVPVYETKLESGDIWLILPA